jgi:hypothetical protein
VRRLPTPTAALPGESRSYARREALLGKRTLLFGRAHNSTHDADPFVIQRWVVVGATLTSAVFI